MKQIKLEVKGLVQGIGFRPFVAGLAEELGLGGQVYNAGGVVFITAIGNDQALEQFVQRLTLLCPKPGKVDEILVTEELIFEGEIEAFMIVESIKNEDDLRFVPADLATCEICEAELKDRNNRRYKHPFISCVACGPRYSIMKSLPYDRQTITMDEFELCPECEAEYKRPGDRRRHAQTIACKECGPKLTLSIGENVDKPKQDVDEISMAALLLKSGYIGAVKDIGGYHICFDPENGVAARRLRIWKNRENKPFAVMFSNVDSIKEYCAVNEAEEALLESEARPIVLLEKNKDFAEEICCGSDRIGAMLPCNPLQILLIEQTGPLVMTSCNRGGEPIVISDEVTFRLLEEGAVDFVLSHDRQILTPLEDSVTQVHRVNNVYKTQFIRRGRGYVPNPVDMGRKLGCEAIGSGGDLKSVFALGKKNFAYLSAPYGDLDDYRCLMAKNAEVQRMEDILGITPKEYVIDKHPSYLSRTMAEGKASVKEVFHHHAHLLSVMAEHHLTECLGIAFDGTGYGNDGGIWGGEWLLCQGSSFERVGSIKPVKLMGSDVASKDCKLSALGYYMAAGLVDEDHRLEFGEDIVKVMSMDFGKVESTSMGRLFDAVAYTLDICNYNTYEGEAASKLEVAANAVRDEDVPAKVTLELTLAIEDDERLVIDTVSLVRKLYELKQSGVDSRILARTFHMALVEGSCAMVEKVLGQQKQPIVFSGGCFVNRLLYKGIFEKLSKLGFEVYVNEKAPCTDGGIALGQLYSLTF